MSVTMKQRRSGLSGLHQTEVLATREAAISSSNSNSTSSSRSNPTTGSACGSTSSTSSSEPLDTLLTRNRFYSRTKSASDTDLADPSYQLSMDGRSSHASKRLTNNDNSYKSNSNRNLLSVDGDFLRYRGDPADLPRVSRDDINIARSSGLCYDRTPDTSERLPRSDITVNVIPPSVSSSQRRDSKSPESSLDSSDSSGAAAQWPELLPSPTLTRLQDAGPPLVTPLSQLTFGELEIYFNRVVQSIKIDRVSLMPRLERTRRERDTAHANYYRELDVVNTHMATVREECLKGDIGSELFLPKKDLSVLRVAVTALVSASQDWAGVHREWSVSRYVEVLQEYTDIIVAKHKDAEKRISRLSAMIPPPSPASQRTRNLSLVATASDRRLSLVHGGVGVGSSRNSPGQPQSSPSSCLRMPRAAYAGRRASLGPNLKPFREPLLGAVTSGSGVLPALNLARVSSISEEGECGVDAVTLATSRAFSSPTPHPPSTTTTAHFPHMTDALPHRDGFRDSDEPDDEDEDDYLSDDLDYELEELHQYPPPPDIHSTVVYRSRSGESLRRVCSWLRGSEQWPWSRQQTMATVQWSVCCALLVMALMVLVAVSVTSHSQEGLWDCRQSWTCLFRPCHPFVQLTYIGSDEVPV